MSFDLAVLAMELSANSSSALAMLERCHRVARHPEGDIDTRITAFCEALFAQFPVTAVDSAWMTDPEVGIDHVMMHLSWSPRSDQVIETIQELARHHGLVLVDPQSDDVYLPAVPAACQNGSETRDTGRPQTTKKPVPVRQAAVGPRT